MAAADGIHHAPPPSGSQISIQPSVPPKIEGWNVFQNENGTYSASKSVNGYTYTLYPDRGGDLAQLCQRVESQFISRMNAFAQEMQSKGQSFESLSVTLPKDSDPIIKAHTGKDAQV